ncbi:hypothetical protein EXIGLDRAFT_775824 [Exidia glandulosa HHB12029]|uniref:Uncharacterized protein n=1 Tax=Exidia glandulosa HHB12029 TaxID=1314781 RepID=A0A165DRD6_EXIGL|nr:hypothetical protein EXIGLDRAFT_775824 [Exidia glandulosa HHB12029]
MPTGVANILPPDDDNEGGRGCGGHESCSCEQRVDDLAHCKGRSKPSFSSGGADVVQMLKLLDGRAEQLCSDTGFCGDWFWDCVQRRDEDNDDAISFKQTGRLTGLNARIHYGHVPIRRSRTSLGCCRRLQALALQASLNHPAAEIKPIRASAKSSSRSKRAKSTRQPPRA